MIVMAANQIGYEVVKYLHDIKEKIDVLVLDRANLENMNDSIIECIGDNTFVIYYEDLNCSDIRKQIKDLTLNFGILAWWPYIIKKDIIGLTDRGFVNLHPAFLPYGRGKHPYIWNIVEETMFGASIHWINEKIDEGAIIDREKIRVTWEDTGETLYYKARQLTFDLFKKNYEAIRDGRENNLGNIAENEGTFHYSKDLHRLDEIKLDKEYKAKEFLNILRSRMFGGSGNVYFNDGTERYCISIKIERCSK